MANLVSCVRCRAEVPVGDTTFNANGDYLCRRCTDVKDLENQVELARQEALRNATSSRGGVAGLIQTWLARRRAKKEHAAMTAAMPNLDELPTICTRCGKPAPRGRSLCTTCQPA